MLVLILAAAFGALIGFIACLKMRKLHLAPANGAFIGAVIAGFIAWHEIGTRTPQNIYLPAPGETIAGIVQSNRAVLVDYYADWCPPCKSLKPVLDKLAGDYAGRVLFVGVNVDKHAAEAQAAGIVGIPDVRIYENGRQLRQISGFNHRSVYESALKEVL